MTNVIGKLEMIEVCTKREINLKTIFKKRRMSDSYNNSIVPTTRNYRKLYQDLKVEYENMQQQYEVLEAEYRENTIVQSMNDMKEQYEELLKTTVSMYRFRSLEDKHNKIVLNANAGSIICNHVIRLLKEIESNLFDTTSRDNLYKAHVQVSIIKDILDDI